MGNRIVTAMLLVLALAACGSPSATPSLAEVATPVPTQTEAPKSPEEVQAALMAEWQTVIQQVEVLTTVCGRALHTVWNYGDKKIEVGQALGELEVEAALARTSQQVLSSADLPSAPVEPYLAELTRLASILVQTLESGEGALVDQAATTLGDTHQSLYELTKAIPEAARGAGLENSSLSMLWQEIYPTTEPLYGDSPLIPVTEVASASADQEALMDLWRTAYVQGSLLFETCTMVYQTHADYNQGEVSLERAQAELEAEAEFIEGVQAAIAAPSLDAAVSDHLAAIGDRVAVLLGTVQVDEDDVGSPDVLSEIEMQCESLQGRMDAIATGAQAAGLGSAAMSKLDAEASPLIDDLYNRTLYGR